MDRCWQMANKVPDPKRYQELPKLSKKTNNPIFKKQAKKPHENLSLNRHFTTEKTRTANNHTEICQTSPVPGEMQMKPQ